jgi:hypothetical protein
VSGGCILLVASVVAGYKLLPFIRNAGDEIASVGPLAAAAFATVFEISVLLATPVGFAWAASELVASEQARSAMGPAAGKRMLRGLVVTALAWGAVTAVLGGIANAELGAPGRVANGLLETARDSCSRSHGDKNVTIPILGSRWHCSDGNSPVLLGELSRLNAALSYSAASMRVSEDLTYVELSSLKLTSPSATGQPALRVTVEGAKVHGFWALARSVRLGEWGRACFVSATVALLGVVAALLVGLCRSSRITAPIYGFTIALSAWLTFLFLDNREPTHSSHYVLVPLAGCLTAGLLLALSLVIRSEFGLRERLNVYRKQFDSTPF